jgi:hypothetical protein
VLPYLMACGNTSGISSNEIEDFGTERTKVGAFGGDTGLETGYSEFGERWHGLGCQPSCIG